MPALNAKSSAGSVMIRGVEDEGKVTGSTLTFSTFTYLSDA